MKKGLLLIGFLLLYSLTARSQINRSGTPLISWFDTAETQGDLVNLSITMDKRGVMYFGNESDGIVTYDGSGWGLISMNSPQRVTSLVTDRRGVVFVGGENDFGFLQPDQSGRLTYCSLGERIADTAVAEGIMTITSIVADSTRVYFSDGRRLYILDILGDSLTTIDMKRDYGLSSAGRLLIFNGRTIIADNREGLFEYADGKIFSLNGGKEVRKTRFVSLLQYDRDNILIGTAERGLMLFNLRTGTVNSRFLGKEDSGRLMRANLTTVVILPGNLIAAGLSNGGGIYIFSHEGKLLQYISGETTSIRESSVTAMYCDYTSNSQLWFCTKGFINKAYVSLPACEFGSAAGILSVASSFAEFKDSLFVGTNDGLYKGYSDKSGVRRFRKLNDPGSEVNALLVMDMANGQSLLAATGGGLWHIDEQGDALGFLPQVNMTALSAVENNASMVVAGSAIGTIRTLMYSDGGWSVLNTSRSGDLHGRVISIMQSERDDWWILTASPSSIVRMHCEASDTTFTRYGREQGADCETFNSMIIVDKRLYICTDKGVYHYDPDDDTFVRDHDLIGNSFDNVAVNNLIKTPEGDIFLSGSDSRNFNALVRTTRQGHVIFRKQFDFLPDVHTTCLAFIEGTVWVAKGRSIFVINNAKIGFSYGTFSAFFTRINAGKKLLMADSFYTLTPQGIRIPSTGQPAGDVITLKHNNNEITFRWTTTSYVGEENTEYRYRLDNFDGEWSDWQKRTIRDYTSLPSGDYIFRLKAKTITGLETEEVIFSFSVARPWYGSLLAVLLYVAAALLIIFMIIRHLVKTQKNLNLRLDSLLRKRSETAEKSKEELSSLEQYSVAIQKTVQLSEKRLADLFPNSFIMNKPRQIISGDFCWMAGKTERCLIAVGDCTGHGVLSALQSLKIMSLLDRAASSGVAVKPAGILNGLHERLASLQTTPSGAVTEQGVTDLALLSVDRTDGLVEFAGAATQCFRVTEMSNAEAARWKSGESVDDETTLTDGRYRLETVSGDRMPMGMNMQRIREFARYEWELEKETSYYIFTDGYSDQFNGVTGKKFMKKNFRKLVLDIQKYPMKKQKEILEERLESWMGSSPQTDDILIVGFRIE